MWLLRNRQARLLLMLLAALSAAGVTAVALLSPVCAIIMAALSLLSLATTTYFTRWRYRQIAALSDYLKRINAGDYTMDLRDNEEGELSILKNELYRVTVTLRERNEALSREKTELRSALSDISHQLKTPLASLFVMTDLLCDVNLPVERRVVFTERIRMQLERLEWLVSSLLKLSRLDAGTIDFHKVFTSAHALIKKALEPLLISMELKSQRLDICADDTAVNCDPNWTAEALLNILKNCMEHTPPGGLICVTFTSTPLFKRFLIEDTGPGIAKEDLPRIFERFYRGRNAADGNVGIGLAMARAIVTAQNGSIEARNRIDRVGAAFYVTLP